MKDFNRFGNMNIPEHYHDHPYLLYRKPFRIAGGTYFVGNEWCSSHLINTGDGLILLDTPTGPALPGLIANIAELGFKLSDIKIILISHGHVDHFACVNQLQYLCDAKSYISRVDAEYIENDKEGIREMIGNMGPFTESFVPDVLLEDGDVIELGNKKIRCVLTPGHSPGTMSHFWTEVEDGRELNVGIYGGAGFYTASPKFLERAGLPLTLQQDFLDSIEKVWNEPVDVALGNHPFHADAFIKGEKVAAGDKDAFVDPEEWQRFLTELREGFKDFVKEKPEMDINDNASSQWGMYYGVHELKHDVEYYKK